MQDKIIAKPGGTFISKAVMLDALFGSGVFKFIFFFVWIIGFISVALIVASLMYIDMKAYLSPSLFYFALFLTYIALRSYFFNKIRNPRLLTASHALELLEQGKQVNIFAAFSLPLAAATGNLFRQKNIAEITTKDLLTAILPAGDLRFILTRLGLSPELVMPIIANYTGEKQTAQVLLKSLEFAATDGVDEINSGTILAGLSEIDDFTKKIANELKINQADINHLVSWQHKIAHQIEKRKNFLEPDKLKLTGGFGKDWAFGYTLFLRQYSLDITQAIKETGLNLEIIGRDNEIRQIEEALQKQANGNVIVVGDAGSGKRTTILGFAKKVLEGNAPASFSHYHVFQIDTGALLSGISDSGELTEAVGRLLSEAANAGNVIVFIENIENLLQEGGGGRANAAEVLIPWLDRGGVHIIGTCSIDSYNTTILQNPSLTQRFTRVSIEDPSSEEMTRILLDTIPALEYRTGAFISYEAIKAAQKAANKYILNLPDPEKSINLLEGATTKAISGRGKTIVTPEDIDNYVAEKYSVPSVEMGENEKDVLLNLEKKMHETIIGQEEPVKAIANAMRRARVSVSETNKPIGSFLFLGPTGVGKTALAKALARSYFGQETNMIRFDMSEFQNQADIYRLIGSNEAGENSPGLLVQQIREKPFSLLLFDEIEKANPDILNLFLQILDEGLLSDVNGKKVSFRNSIIIATSNAGANLIRESIQKKIPYDKLKEGLIDYLVKNNLFRPELINRFTAVIAFSPLTLPEINQIAVLMINKLCKETYANKNVTLQVAPDAIAELARRGFDPEMGARPMERVIQEKVENLLAEKILKNEIKQGGSFVVTKEMIH